VCLPQVQDLHKAPGECRPEPPSSKQLMPSSAALCNWVLHQHTWFYRYSKKPHPFALHDENLTMGPARHMLLTQFCGDIKDSARGQRISFLYRVDMLTLGFSVVLGCDEGDHKGCNHMKDAQRTKFLEDAGYTIFRCNPDGDENY
jgi:hypothetical protein